MMLIILAYKKENFINVYQSESYDWLDYLFKLHPSVWCGPVPNRLTRKSTVEDAKELALAHNIILDIQFLDITVKVDEVNLVGINPKSVANGFRES